MRLVFLGASNFGLKCLQEALDEKHCEVVGVVTAPREFKISYRPQGVDNVMHVDLIEFCSEHQLPCEKLTDDMRDKKLLNTVRNWRPDAFLVAGWYHMIPESWRNLAPAYGLHASLLPDYSGGAPLVWAILNGEKETGITFFKMDAGVDSGPIVGQKTETIHPDDTIATLYERIENLGLELISQYLPKLARGQFALTDQDESKRRVFPQRGPEDGAINWNMDMTSICDFVRAQTKPYPGAFTTLNSEKIKVWSVSPNSLPTEEDLVPGQVLGHPSCTLVKTGTGIIEINESTFRGKDINGNELRKHLKCAVFGN
jgi:methionyl-tRNA formyltransferase